MSRYILNPNIALRSWQLVPYAYYIKGARNARGLKKEEQAQKCGINAFTITGGEPMVHENFFEIVESIYAHGMYLEELNTNGFHVKAQANVHRLNIESMLPTAEMLDEMGVDEMRIIRTSESPRWKENAGDSCLEIEEYYEKIKETLCGWKNIAPMEGE